MKKPDNQFHLLQWASDSFRRSREFEKPIAVAKKFITPYSGEWNGFVRATNDLGRSRDGRRLGICLHPVEMEKMASVSVALGELER
jgi:hypothetical protein